MSWRYRPFKVIEKHATYYCVKEFYQPPSGPAGWTIHPITPIGDTKKELIEILELMLKDCKRYNAKTEDLTKERK